MSEIKLVVFNNGLQLLGDLVQFDSNKLVLANLVALVIMPSKTQGTASMAFQPYLEYTEEYKNGISFFSGDVLAVTTPIEELRKQYISMFTSLVFP